MKSTKDLYLGDTILTWDPEWAGADGTHAYRTAIYIGDNGDGTATIMKTSTSNARSGRLAGRHEYRLTPDGAGRGNSLNKTCDIIGGHRGLANMANGQIIRRLGTLDTAAIDWIESELDSMGI